MSDINSNGPNNEDTLAAHNNPFSSQPTGLVETTFAETIGLSMHNAVTNQQSSQMTTSASITNACARLLQAPALTPANTSKHLAPLPAPEEASEPEPTAEQNNKKRMFWSWFLRKPNSAEATAGDKE